MSSINVSVYVEGARRPDVINPCRNIEEAEALAERIRSQIKARGWTQVVRIEQE